MNETEKSLKLAELMGWNAWGKDGVALVTVTQYPDADVYLQPYQPTKDGLAQFAAILLKFPEIMQRFGTLKGIWHVRNKDCEIRECKPTQSTILDTILRINGVEI